MWKLKYVQPKLTHNLQGDCGFVFEAVHLNGHFKNSRVLPLSWADKHDAVLATVPDIDPFRIQRLAIFEPRDNRVWFSLKWEYKETDKCYCVICAILWTKFVCCESFLQGRGWPGWSVLQLAWHSEIWEREACESWGGLKNKTFNICIFSQIQLQNIHDMIISNIVFYYMFTKWHHPHN